ncbi:MAG TPA: protein kinase [Miltoncostaeaceae bacterium]|nr:protein kinase [Miltoncostaeaceae bacterium]
MTVRTSLLGGRYRLEELIGRGGMASVWRAHDVVLERPVAVKRLHARFQDDPELAERFRREAQVVARLSHPNLVRLLDQGDDNGEPFLVFELVEGVDLKARIRAQGALPPDQAASICAQVARALASAHRRGIVHRDIKSHNVLVTPDGRAKLTDFGIARMLGDEGALTRTGIVMGSSDYLSPEQAEGRPVDPRGDVYSLGVVLFEALTGTLPFRGENAVAVATKHVHERPPDPRMVDPSVPAQLAAVTGCALEKRPGDRFGTADAFADALEGHGPTRVMPPDEDTGQMPRRRRRRRWPILVGVLVAVAAAAGVLWKAGVAGTDHGSGGGTAASQAGTTALTIQAVRDYDPFGTGGENGGQAANATDGDPQTTWNTEHYSGGLNKPGVGLVLTLPGSERLTDVTIDSPTPGAAFEIRAAPEDNGPGRVLASGTLSGDGQRVAIPERPVGREFVVWLTGLVPDPQAGDRLWASIGEVRLRGVPNP